MKKLKHKNGKKAFKNLQIQLKLSTDLLTFNFFRLFWEPKMFFSILRKILRNSDLFQLGTKMEIFEKNKAHVSKQPEFC